MPLHFKMKSRGNVNFTRSEGCLIRRMPWDCRYKEVNKERRKEVCSKIQTIHLFRFNILVSAVLLAANGEKEHVVGNCGAQASSSKEEDANYHRTDEQVNILLESQINGSLKPMRRKFIRCSAQATITHLKKFIAKKLYNNLDKYKEVCASLKRNFKGSVKGELIAMLC